MLEQSDSDDELDDVEETFIEPPAAGEETDEDSADEDNSSGGKMNNLSGRQLQAGAEALLRSGKRISCQNGEDQQPENYKIGDRQFLPKKKKIRKTIHWEKEDIISETANIFPESNHAMFWGKKPYKIFEKFFNDELLLLITIEIQTYALYKNDLDPKVSVEELRVPTPRDIDAFWLCPCSIP